MGRPGDNSRDHRHRDDFEKEEEEELDDELLDDYDDLIGGQVDNSMVAGAVEAARIHRGTAEMDTNELDDMFEVIEQRDFVGAPPPAIEVAPREQSTADEDEEAAPLAAPPPTDDEEEALPGAVFGERWTADIDETLAAPSATEVFIKGDSDWLKD